MSRLFPDTYLETDLNRLLPEEVMRIAVYMFLMLVTIPCMATCFPTFAAKLTYPAKASLEVGVSSHDLGSLFSIADGFVIRAEPGLSGGKLHAGIRSQFTFLFLPLVTWDYTISALRTWNDPWGGYANDQTYIGIEAQGKVNLVLMSAGVYWHVTGDDEEHDVLFSGAVGFGF